MLEEFRFGIVELMENRIRSIKENLENVLYEGESKIIDEIYEEKSKTLDVIIKKLKAKNKETGEDLEDAINGIKTILVEKAYKQGFEDGRQFQEFAKPQICRGCNVPTEELERF